jgi:hypothetical protein
MVMPETTTRLPEQIPAGLSFEAALAFADYPATEWALQAIIRGPQAITLDATASGTDHLFASTATTTAAWVPGRYWYSLRATKAGEVREIASGQLQVLADLAAVEDGFDGRSQSEIALDNINAVLSKRATVDQERYRINNRELWRMRVEDLLKLRSFYATQVRREHAKKSGNSAFGRNIPVRFS